MYLLFSFLRKGKETVLLNLGKTDKNICKCLGKTDKTPPSYIGKEDKEILKTSDFFIIWCLKTSDFLKIIVVHHAFILVKVLIVNPLYAIYLCLCFLSLTL